MTAPMLSYLLPTDTFILDTDASILERFGSVADTRWSGDVDRLLQQHTVEVVKELLRHQERIVGDRENLQIQISVQKKVSAENGPCIPELATAIQESRGSFGHRNGDANLGDIVKTTVLIATEPRRRMPWQEESPL